MPDSTETPEQKFAALAQRAGILDPIRAQLKALQEQMNGISSKLTAALDMVQRPPEALPSVHGLCGDPACSDCANQGRQLVQESYIKGRQSMVQDIDTWAEAAGGEPLKARLAQAIQLGRERLKAITP